MYQHPLLSLLHAQNWEPLVEMLLYVSIVDLLVIGALIAAIEYGPYQTRPVFGMGILAVITLSAMQVVPVAQDFLHLGQAQAKTGTITVVVRDQHSQVVADVTVSLWEDLDVDGRRHIRDMRTNTQGIAQFPDLPYSTYAVVFTGVGIVPTNQQAQEPVGDGPGVTGYGIRLDRSDLTRLFVVGPAGVPFFDAASSTSEVAQPYRAALSTEQPAIAPPVPNQPQGRINLLYLALIGSVVVLSVLVWHWMKRGVR